MAGPSPDSALAMAGLASAFDDWLAVWERQPFAAIVDAWTARAYGLGEAATARLPTETVHGIAEGLDADGSLRLKAADGSIRRITAGDVFFGDA
jgi:BirA family biotin operon repressor/biotin-[acetyl-CoA-carboxylase] ligase